VDVFEDQCFRLSSTCGMVSEKISFSAILGILVLELLSPRIPAHSFLVCSFLLSMCVGSVIVRFWEC